MIQAIDIVQIGRKIWVYKWHNKVGAVVDDSASREHLGAEVDIVGGQSIADIFNGYAERYPGVPVTICHNLRDMWPQLNRQPVATLPTTETP